MMDTSRPWRKVAERVHPPGMGMWDVLECGHQLPYPGIKHDRRRCNECPPDSPEVGSEQLGFDLP